MSMESSGEERNEADAQFELPQIDPTKVDNSILRTALERVQQRSNQPAHMGHYTKHSSHASHSKSAW